MRAYAIGDIHGQLGKLQLAHELIELDRQETDDREAPVVHVGDLVDRGPDSRGVIEHLLNGISHGENWVVLKGNHDRMFAGFLRDPNHHDPKLYEGLTWISPMLGGRETLASYGVKVSEDDTCLDVHTRTKQNVPEAHIAFLETRPLWHQIEEVIFVHAGIRPGVPMEKQREDDLVWIRDEFLYDLTDHGALIVHGHTVIDEATHFGNRLAIDTGAGYGDPLSAVVIEGRDAWLLTLDGRKPLR